MNYFITVLFLLIASVLPAQQLFSISGIVTDEKSEPLPGAVVRIEVLGKGVVTGSDGEYILEGISPGAYFVEASFLGYNTWIQKIDVPEQLPLHIMLHPDDKALGEVLVEGSYRSVLDRSDSRNIMVVDQKFIADHLSGSLMQTLQRLPGVSSMDIGSGQSKPVIRGLGFNRLMVFENGVAHQGQQWGADHGLEIDQYGVGRIEVIKGPASLMYGAGAIGGVLDLKNFAAPTQYSSGIEVDVTGRSNNQSFGGSALYFTRKDKLFFSGRLSVTDYGDYRVPADSIEYYSYFFNLKDGAMSNTAGWDRSGNAILGWADDDFSTQLTISGNHSKSGFFANAHGLEIRTSSIDYDRSSRSIDLPYQAVRHWKAISNTTIRTGGHRINIDIGWQHNLRREFSEAVEHGHMPLPPDSLEREFRKDTRTLNTRWALPKTGRHRLSLGYSLEYQDNLIDGWGFIIPSFRNLATGIYVHDKITFSSRWTVNAGMRYDWAEVHVLPYTDWFATPSGDDDVFIQRAPDARRSFSNISWALGANYFTKPAFVKINFGNGFRMPTPKELAANGLNYHMYRYEEGNISLSPEVSWQLDAVAGWNNHRAELEFSPYATWFPNYIYLSPEAGYHQGLQRFGYRENEIFRTGGEVVFHFRWNEHFEGSVDSEYVYARQLSGNKKGFTLPFSPPWTTNFALKYSHGKVYLFNRAFVKLEYRMVAAQNEIVPPEKKTPGYSITSLHGGVGTRWGKGEINWRFQIQNIFNVRYLDHTSFYRLIEAPGPGRNFVMSMNFKF